MTPDETCIGQYLQRQPDPATTSFSWTGGQIDQSALHDKVTGLASWLSNAGLTHGDRVAVLLPKGPTAAAALLACLAAGVIAVPCDFHAPAARTTDLLNDLTPALVITTDERRADLPRTFRLIAVTPDDPATLPHSTRPLGRFDRPVDTAALILPTSGSTGTPKGVVLSYRNVTTFLHWAVEHFALTRADRFLSIAPFHFDLATLDLLGSQMIGASVHLLGEVETRLPGAIAKALHEKRITIAYTVPTVLTMMTTLKAFSGGVGADLRWLLSAGEVLPTALLTSLKAALPDTRIANLYGPTETNVISCHIAGTVDPSLPTTPIGLPCAHSQITICDPDGVALPDGTDGEICVHGPSVMLGYWNRPQATQDARVAGADDSYRTGDFGRFAADGSLTFLGRRDQQVKIRGHRLELTEVEAKALATGLVQAACAVLIETDPQRPKLVLCAIVRDDTISPKAIKASMTKHLPRHALPDTVFIVPSFRFTSSGKIDRNAIRQLATDHLERD